MLALKARQDAYVYPPRSRLVLPRADTGTLVDMGWVAQYKVNDSHLLLKLLPDEVQLWGRRGERLAYRPAPEMIEEIRLAQDALGLDRRQYHLLDGGLLDSRHAAVRDTIAIWDILVRDGEQLLGTTYGERHASLLPAGDRFYRMPGSDAAVGLLLRPEIFVSLSFEPDPERAWDAMWETVEAVNAPYPQPLLEGIVLKSPEGKLEPGYSERNNGSWVVRSRVATRRHQF